MTLGLLANARLVRLIGAGYFPSELPPPFSTLSLANHMTAIRDAIDLEQVDKAWTSPERFNIPKWGQSRRTLSLVNPINQIRVSQLIAQHWPQIAPRLSRSAVSEFHPQIVMIGGRAVNGVDFDAVSRRKSAILARHGRYVKTDVTRFYPSVYTHSIPWAFMGKSQAKEAFNTKAFKDSFINKLDAAVRAGQNGQTMGIPIGPDTSRIISELIMTEIETLINQEIHDLPRRAVRYVDDILIGIRQSETPETILSKISSALYEYELELSADKTTVKGVGVPHTPEWVQYIRSFSVSNRKSTQREDLDSFFEQALHLADRNVKESVLLYAKKRAQSFHILPENWDHLIRWMIYCARRAPDCLSSIVEFIASSHASGTQAPLQEILDFIVDELPFRAGAAHTYEVAWLLFLARELAIQLPSTALNSVLALRSSVCALLLMDLRDAALIDGPIDLSHWRSFANEAGLASEMWLVAYEATRKGWWGSPSIPSQYIQQHPRFGSLWANNVEFYVRANRARSRVQRPFFFGGGGAGGPYDR